MRKNTFTTQRFLAAVTTLIVMTPNGHCADDNHELGTSTPLSDAGLMTSPQEPLEQCRYRDKKESQWKQVIFEKDPVSGLEMPFFYYFAQAPSDPVPDKKTSSKKGKEKLSASCTTFEMTGVTDSRVVDVTGCQSTKACLIKIDAVMNDITDMTCEHNPNRIQSVRLRSNRLLRFPAGNISSDEISVVFQYDTKADSSPSMVQFSEKAPTSRYLIRPIDDDASEEENKKELPRIIFERDAAGNYTFKRTGSSSLNMESIAEIAKKWNGQDNLKEVFKATGTEVEVLNRLCQEQKEHLVLAKAAKSKKYLPRHYAEDFIRRGF